MDQRFGKGMINVICYFHLDKNKVMWVLSGDDFVDLLYSFLTMPLGTIVRLLEYHGRYRTKKENIGCLNNLYKSVVDMNTENFKTEACKEMLIYPKSMKEGLCRKLKINIDDTEVSKYFMCPMSMQRKSCGEFFSYFNTSKCSCGNLMNKEIDSPKGEESINGFGGCNDYAGVFVHGDGNMAFMTSDDLQIENCSHDHVRKRLKDLGYTERIYQKVGEDEPEIGFREAMTLLRLLFTSETPLTTTFNLPYSSSCPSTRAYKPSKPCGSVLGQVLSFDVYLSKQDKRKVIYARCNEDFINLICTFLVLPLEYICEISCREDEDDGLGCIGNLFRSFKGINCGEITIPWYYTCRKNLLGIRVSNPPSFYDFDERLKKVIAMDPKSESSGQSRSGGGFMKSNRKFLVSDDLRITPLNSNLTMKELKELKISSDEAMIEPITIGRTEAINLLKATFSTSSALTNGLSDLLSEKLEG